MTHKSHIVIVANSVALGSGVANAAHAQAKALAEHFEITLLTSSGTVEHPAINRIQVNEPKLFWLRRYSHSIREYLFSHRVRRALLKLHKDKPIAFTIFHSHTSAALAGITLRKHTAVKIAAVTHGDIFSRPAGTYDSWLSALYRWTSRLSYQNCDLIIALSPTMQEAVARHRGNTDGVALIPNGIAVEHIDKSDKGKMPKQAISSPVKILSIGRLAIEKDLKTLLAAIARLDIGSTKIQLTIAGDGPMRSSLLTQIEELKLSKVVQLLGQVRQDEIKTLYLEHDIFCITSISDPLPTVVLEAMSYGLAIIGTKVDGIPYMVTDGFNGLVIPAGNVEACTQALDTLIGNPVMRQEMGLRGQSRVLADFSWETSASKLKHEILKRL